MRKTMAAPETDVLAAVKLIFTCPEAAVVLGMGTSTLYEKLLSGEIASFKIGRARRLHRAELERYAAQVAGLNTGDGPRAA